MERALMNTEAGKIQGNLVTWGFEEVQDYNVPWGNYDVKDTDGQVPQVGSDEYKQYMKAMVAAHGDQYPTELKMVPQPTVEEIAVSIMAEVIEFFWPSLTYLSASVLVPS